MSTPQKQVIKGVEGLELVLDAREIFPNDPGQGTPAMVILKRNGRETDSGTFWCAIGERELSYNGTRLTDYQLEWLLSQEGTVNQFIEKHGNTAEEG